MVTNYRHSVRLSHGADSTDDRLAIYSAIETQPTSSFIWTWQETLLAIPLSLIVIGTIFGNFLVLYVVATRSHNLRLPTHFFIANLAVADFLVGVFVMPFLATLQVTGRWYFGDVYCETWTVTHFWLCSASILSTCAVCIERYIGVRFPLKHKEIMNQRRIWGMIACVWVFAGLLTLSSIYIFPEPDIDTPYSCKINQQIGHVIIAVVGILYIPAVIMIVFYWQIYVLATRHLKFLKHNSFAVPPNVPPSLETQKRTSNGLPAIPERDVTTSEVSLSTSGVSPRGSTENLEQYQPNQKKGSAISGTSSNFSVVSSTTSNTNSNVSLLAKNVQSKKQINLAKRLSCLVGVLLASYLPFFTLYLIMAFHPGSINVRVFNAFGWIRYFNSCLNPFIYAFAVPAYRKAMTDVIRNGVGNVQRLIKR
ncbi:unnamed protein product [Orchesella dallaii]|uniref:G-protein coupled receptors family 1 profile domain-containing protein n=1 Tax=Orchesella dallaii TaxID=48710 RepID=A0ABP1Q569_9HEXA